MKFEEILREYVGEWGRYQKLQILLVSIPTIFTAIHALSWTFSSAKLPHRCVLPSEPSNWTFHPLNTNFGNLSTPVEDFKCELREGWSLQDYFKKQSSPSPSPVDSAASDEVACDSFKYDYSEITRSAISEFDIICGRGWIRAFIQSMYYVGQFFGSIFFGVMGDKFGRKPVFLGAILVQALSGASMSFAPHWIVFAILRVLVGFCHPGIFVIAVVIGMELVGPEKRKVAGVITGTFYAVGQVILGFVAFGVRDYKMLQLVISLPGLIFLSYYWIIPESARWLIAKERFPEATQILSKASKMNGKVLPEEWHTELETSPEAGGGGEAKEESPGLLGLMKDSVARYRMLLMFICWPVVSGVYYGLSMNPTFFGGDRYWTFIGAATMEIPGLLLSFFTLDRWGRKTLCCLGYSVCALLLFSTLIVPEDLSWVTPIQVVLSKAAITLVYASIYTWTPELFPTPVRNTALGACSMMARVGAVSASYISMWLVDKSRLAVVLIFATAAFLATLAALFLPETARRPLPETFQNLHTTKLSYLPLCCQSKSQHSPDEAQQLNEIKT